MRRVQVGVSNFSGCSLLVGNRKEVRNEKVPMRKADFQEINKKKKRFTKYRRTKFRRNDSSIIIDILLPGSAADARAMASSVRCETLANGEFDVLSAWYTRSSQGWVQRPTRSILACVTDLTGE